MALQSFLHIFNASHLEPAMVDTLAKELKWTGDSEIVDGKTLKIEVAREMIAAAARRPLHQSEWRWVITDAQLLTKNVANTMLKVIEEPPIYLTIHLLTTNPMQILPTILSRTMRVYHPWPANYNANPDTVFGLPELERWRWAKNAAEDPELVGQLSSWVIAFKQFDRWREAQLTADLIDRLSSATASKRLMLENYLLAMNSLAVDKPIQYQVN